MARRATAKFNLTAENKTKNAFSEVTRGISGLKNQFASLMPAVGAVAGATGFGMLIQRTAEAGDMYDKMSQRTGMTVENLSRLGFAADRTGADIQSVEKSVKYLTQQMLDVSRGTGESKDTFDELGVSVKNTDGSLRSAYDVFLDIAGKIGDLDDETRQAAYAMELFGARAGQGLVPMLKQGADGIAELAKRSDEIGNTWSTKDADAAAKFTDATRDLTGALGGLGRALAIDVIPFLTEGAGALTEWVSNNRELVSSKLDETFEGIGAALKVIDENKDALKSALIVPKAAYSLLDDTAEVLAKIAYAGWKLGQATKEIDPKVLTAMMMGPGSRPDLSKTQREWGGSYGVRPKRNAKTPTSAANAGLMTVEPLPIGAELEKYELDWEKHYSTLLTMDNEFQEQRRSLWMRNMETQIQLSLDGVEEQKELLRFRYEAEYGMLKEHDERKILARQVLNNELMLLDEEYAEWKEKSDQAMLNKEEMQMVSFGQRWGAMLWNARSDNKSFVEGVVDDFAMMFQRITAMAAVSGLFGLATGGTFSTGFNAVLKSAFGGFRAGGGPVSSGKAYVVGERGPELYVPKAAGTVLPNGAGVMQGGSTSITLNVSDKEVSAMNMMNRRQLAETLLSMARDGELDQFIAKAAGRA